MKYALMVASVLFSLALCFPLTAQADDPSVCISLTPGGAGTPIVGAPVVILDVFASNKAGSTSTVYALNGTASSTQVTAPPFKELFYLLSGTGYITTKNAAELSLTGTAEDADSIKEVVFHVVIDGEDGHYTQVIRSSGGDGSSVLTGVAKVSQSCGKKK